MPLMRRSPTLLLILLLAACTGGRPPAPVVPAAGARLPAAALGASAHFVFVADEAASLHHFLYEWAQSESVAGSPKFAARAELAGLPEPELLAWEEALGFYSRKIVHRSLLWDVGLLQLRDHLLGLRPLFPSDETNREAALHLGTVAPTYRRLFWPRHLEVARAWVAAYLALPALAERENEIARRAGPAFGGSWPTAPVRVDLSPYAGENGAYTTHGPHATVSSFDPGYQGENSLEMVFHEGAHGDLTEEPLRQALEAAYEKRGKRAPRPLTHALHFFTIGEIVRLAAARHGITYQPTVADEVIARAWPAWREPLEKHWRPWLVGQGDREAAFAALIDALIAAEAKARP